ncbi:MAG: hypothetical protein B7Z22_13010, partial [Hyphomonas sp. 32-62-5]
MRQTFDIKGGPQDGRAHLPLLRRELERQGLPIQRPARPLCGPPKPAVFRRSTGQKTRRRKNLF